MSTLTNHTFTQFLSSGAVTFGHISNQTFRRALGAGSFGGQMCREGTPSGITISGS